MDEIKSNLIELFTKLNYNKATSDLFIDFIKTYDGNDSQKFASTMLAALLMLTRLQKLEIKGAAFDMLNEKNEDFDAAFVVLKKEFERINDGSAPETPMKSSE